MTPTPTPPPDLPDAHERARLNAALEATGAQTGFWDDHGNPAPRPDDIDDWAPRTPQHHTHGPHDF
jgi:hypothetical protein